MFRRRPPHLALEPFLRMANELDGAQRFLLASIPTSRDAGIPLSQAVDGFLERLTKAEALMPEWKAKDLEPVHDACARALLAARAEAVALREETAIGFEALNARIGDVLHPLEEFADAERVLRGKSPAI